MTPEPRMTLTARKAEGAIAQQRGWVIALLASSVVGPGVHLVRKLEGVGAVAD